MRYGCYKPTKSLQQLEGTKTTRFQTTTLKRQSNGTDLPTHTSQTPEHNGCQLGIHIQWNYTSHQHQLCTRHIQHRTDQPELGLTIHPSVPNTTPVPIWQPTIHTKFQQLCPTPGKQPQHQTKHRQITQPSCWTS